MLDVMKQRHSVRQYKDVPIEQKVKEKLNAFINQVNLESGISFQIFFDEPTCFDSILAHYGKFSCVKNYIVIVGRKENQEKAGYFGEKIVLECQRLGLNTCWVALTHGKTNAKVLRGQKVLCLIAFGYGENQGVSHKSKKIEELAKWDQEQDWFFKGMEAVCLAPTAINQQKFFFELKNGDVYAHSLPAFYSKLDLGIVKYHFETISKHKIKAKD